MRSYNYLCFSYHLICIGVDFFTTAKMEHVRLFTSTLDVSQDGGDSQTQQSDCCTGIRGAVRALSRLRHQCDAISRPTRHCDCLDSACLNGLAPRTYAAFLWCRVYRVYDFRVGNNVLVTSQLVFTSRELVKKKAARVGEWLATFTLFPLSHVQKSD